MKPLHISNILSSSVVIQQPENKDEQFEHYLDRQFTLNKANLLKNRLSETPSKATTSVENQDVEKGEDAWWLLSKDDQDGLYSICGLFFLFGFIFPPFWWIGSIWPKQVKEKGGKMASRWQKLNRIMSIGFSSILIILIVVFVILYATGYKF